MDDDVAAIAAQYAESRELSLSKSIAELIVRGTRKAPRIKYVDGLPVFDLPKIQAPNHQPAGEGAGSRRTMSFPDLCGHERPC